MIINASLPQYLFQIDFCKNTATRPVRPTLECVKSVCETLATAIFAYPMSVQICCSHKGHAGTKRLTDAAAPTVSLQAADALLTYQTRILATPEERIVSDD